MQILTTIALIVIAILLFELIIFFHEGGHFISAKLSGVKVNEFALGMGPKIFSFKKGETQYSLRLFPIGGFCAMEGEDEESDEPRAFNNAKIWKRMIIVVAGAVMNILLGLIFMLFFVMQADVFSSTTIDVFEPNSYSANCGLQEGDKILKINDYTIWNSRDLTFSFTGVECVEVDGKSLEVYKQDCANAACDVFRELVESKKINENNSDKLYKTLQKDCREINKAKSKEDALSLLEVAVKNLYESVGVSDYTIPTITEKETRPRYIADVIVERDGQEVLLEDVQFFTYMSQSAKEGDKPSVALDFYVQPIEKNFFTVIGETFSQTASIAKMVGYSLVWIVEGRFGFTDLSGPVGIATAVTQVASQGLEVNFGAAVMNILFVMILITVNLGMFNMLPFPALDGGRFVFLIIEGIFRKPIPRKVEQYVNATGFIILILFMMIVSVKDVWQLFTGQLTI